MTVRNTRILFFVFFLFSAAAIVNALFLQSGPATSPVGRQAAERAQKEAEAERKRRLGLASQDSQPKVGALDKPASDAAPQAATAASAVIGASPAPSPATAATKPVPEKKPGTVPRAIQLPQPQASTQPLDDGARRLARLKPDSWRSDDVKSGAVRTDGDILPDAPDAEGDASTVSAVQRELNNRGYGPLAADGVPGLATRAAILAFEHDSGHALTAEATDGLLKRLLLGNAGDAVPADVGRIKTARAEALIRTVQQSLLTLGYDVGRIDGRFGEETQRAIRKFESDEGLIAKGRISAEVFARLARAIAVAKVQVVR